MRRLLAIRVREVAHSYAREAAGLSACALYTAIAGTSVVTVLEGEGERVSIFGGGGGGGGDGGGDIGFDRSGSMTAAMQIMGENGGDAVFEIDTAAAAVTETNQTITAATIDITSATTTAAIPPPTTSTTAVSMDDEITGEGDDMSDLDHSFHSPARKRARTCEAADVAAVVAVTETLGGTGAGAGAGLGMDIQAAAVMMDMATGAALMNKKDRESLLGILEAFVEEVPARTRASTTTNAAPWTLQRLCEVLATPRRFFSKLNTLLGALLTIVAVESRTQPTTLTERSLPPFELRAPPIHWGPRAKPMHAHANTPAPLPDPGVGGGGRVTAFQSQPRFPTSNTSSTFSQMQISQMHLFSPHQQHQQQQQQHSNIFAPHPHQQQQQQQQQPIAIALAAAAAAAAASRAAAATAATARSLFDPLAELQSLYSECDDDDEVEEEEEEEEDE